MDDSKRGPPGVVAPEGNSTVVDHHKTAQSFTFLLTQRDTHTTAYATKLKSSCMRGEELEKNID